MILTELAPSAGEFCLRSAVRGTSPAHPAWTPCRTVRRVPWSSRSPRDAADPARFSGPLQLDQSGRERVPKVVKTKV